MTATKKSCSFLLIFLVASSLLLLQTASAAAKPSTPELTAKYSDYSYDVPLTDKTETNPYTGKQETISEGGYYVENKTIELKIKNPPYNERDYLCYNVRIKGHFTQNWTTLYGTEGSGTPQMSASLYTTITFVDSSGGRFYGPSGALISAPSEGQIDIQVAVTKESVETYGDSHVQFSWGYRYVYTQLGDWSNTQTITIGDSSEAATISPTQSPTAVEDQSPTVTPTPNPVQSGTQDGFTLAFDWQTVVIMILFIAVAALVTIVGVLLRKNARKGGQVE